MNIDLQIFFWINSVAGKVSVIDFVAIFCAKYLYILMGIVVLSYIFVGRDYLSKRKNQLMVVSGLASVITGRLVIVEIIKRVVDRPRPFVDNVVTQLVQYEPNFSFPSGHAAFAFALAGAVIIYNKKVGLWLILVALLISLSRVYVGVHYPFDILVGGLIGLASGLITGIIFKKRFMGSN